MESTIAFYNISIAAKRLGMSVRMIREYEKEGLIKPHRDPGSGYRIFSDEDLQWIRCIRELIHQKGLNIKGIQRLLTLVPCWEIKSCPKEIREKCPAAVDRTLPCWIVAQKSCIEEAKKCKSCKVYLEAHKRIGGE